MSLRRMLLAVVLIPSLAGFEAVARPPFHARPASHLVTNLQTLPPAVRAPGAPVPGEAFSQTLATLPFLFHNRAPDQTNQPAAVGEEFSILSFRPWEHVLSAAWSPDGSLLAAAAGRRIYLYSFPALEEVSRIELEEAAASLAFFPVELPSGTGRALLAASVKDGSVRLWDPLEPELLCRVEAHRRIANRISFSPDGSYLASAGMDAMVRLWDMRPLLERGECRSIPAAELIGGTRAVAGLAFSPDGSLVASIDLRQVRVREIDTQRLVVSLQAGAPVFSVAYSPDGSLATGEPQNLVRLWNTEKGEVLQELQPQESHLPRTFIWSLAYHPSGRYLAAGSSDSSITLFDLVESLKSIRLDGHTLAVSSLAFSPTGEWLASGALDGTLRIWHISP